MTLSAQNSTGAIMARPATLVVINPSGNRNRVPVTPVPFTIGRQADNHLILRDNRASRNHARIVAENGEYYVEDLKSSHGVFVNGTRVTRQKLYAADRIEFGFPDSYSLIFTFDDDEIQKLLDQFSAPKTASAGAGNLAKLRALVEVARALQNSLSTDDVLAAVVDAALAITGFERGFLLLNENGGLKRSACPRPPRQSGSEDGDRGPARQYSERASSTPRTAVDDLLFAGGRFFFNRSIR